MDFEKLSDVRDLADTLLATQPRIDVLAKNAGGMFNSRRVTIDGFERTLQTNYLAPVLLTRLLLPQLQTSGGRVVSTSSNANVQGKVRLDDLGFTEKRWNSGLGAYGASKLMINLFTAELAAQSNVPAYTFHPGFVRPGLAPDWWVLRAIKFITRGRYGVSPEVGAQQLYPPRRHRSDPGTERNLLRPAQAQRQARTPSRRSRTAHGGAGLSRITAKIDICVIVVWAPPPPSSVG